MRILRESDKLRLMQRDLQVLGCAKDRLALADWITICTEKFRRRLIQPDVRNCGSIYVGKSAQQN